jgi:NADH-quinone oxidoreductase subunit L
MTSLWLIPALPAAAAAVNGLLGIRWFSRRVSGIVGCAAMGGAFVLSVAVFAGLLADPAGGRVREIVLGEWIPEIPLATARNIGMFRVPWSLRVDPLAIVMVLVVTVVAFLIHVYATGYMKDEPHGAHARFFCYMNLFCAFMLLLVLAGNFVVLFVGWEGVGLCSYLLIGFWYGKSSAADAGKKAFIVNRIGDTGFLLGVFLVFFAFGTVDFREVASAAAAMPVESGGFGVLSSICLLLCAGAVGKSAQIPLFVWLPDAMEGPTPVSALIHAATMVTAGVYVIARNAVLFEHAPLVLQAVAVIGAVTALMAAAVAVVQTDIKRVLAYSTISQIGYMFLAAGVGAFGAAVFHLATHAFFKAVLFLGSGSVIHALSGEQDLRFMGGLRRQMPVTFVTMAIASLALAGIPPLSGFFSKDQIQYEVFGSHPLLFAMALATTVLTAVYIARLMCLTFLGRRRGTAEPTVSSAEAERAAADHGALHPADAPAHGQAQRPEHEVTHGPPGTGFVVPHDAPSAMTVPLIVLSVGAGLAGLVGIPAALGGRDALGHFLQPVGGALRAVHPAAASATHSRFAELAVMSLSAILAAAAMAVARDVYVRRPELPGRLALRWPKLHLVLSNQFYVDALYRRTVVRGTLVAARRLAVFDERVIDAAVDGAGALTRIAAWLSHMIDSHFLDATVTNLARGAGRGSFLVRRVQSGLIQNYALMMAIGLFAFLTLYLMGG